MIVVYKMNNLGLFLICLSLATLLTWYSFSIWETTEILAPRPTEAASTIVMISNQDAKLNSWLHEMESRYLLRQQNIRKVCEKYGDRLKRKEKSFSKNLMIDTNHRLAYCRHGKVGTSTWLEYFLRMTDINESTKSYLSGKDKILHRIIPELFACWKSRDGNDTRSLVERIRQSQILTFSFVRHPFDRLVSAYVDKIKEQNDASYYSTIAQIQEKYGGGEATFPHFVQFILDSPEIEKCSLQDCDAVDAHWRPFYARCAYCDVDYDVIGKMESFEEDVKYILTKRNLTNLLIENGQVFHLHHSSIEDLKKFNEFQLQRTLNYFSELTEENTKKLFDLYKVDFEMFGFSAEQFFSDKKQNFESEVNQISQV